MRRLLSLTLMIVWMAGVALAEMAPVQEPERVLAPRNPVPKYVERLLEIARGELGYTEERSGYTKYGAWSGDPTAEWCAEFLCWCVSEVDRQDGTELLEKVYPLYSGTNTGLKWFLKQGRYVPRTSVVTDWGPVWFKGETENLEKNAYVPQPGDWVFYSFLENKDTTHVAMVEYCTEDTDGNVTVHVIEGNNPDKVQRNTHALSDWRVLGYGTALDECDIGLRGGNEGAKVTALQQKLHLLGYLTEDSLDGKYGGKTALAVRAFQEAENLTVNGVANHGTQNRLNQRVEEYLLAHPETWLVETE